MKDYELFKKDMIEFLNKRNELHKYCKCDDCYHYSLERENIISTCKNEKLEGILNWEWIIEDDDLMLDFYTYRKLLSGINEYSDKLNLKTKEIEKLQTKIKELESEITSHQKEIDDNKEIIETILNDGQKKPLVEVIKFENGSTISVPNTYSETHRSKRGQNIEVY